MAFGQFWPNEFHPDWPHLIIDHKICIYFNYKTYSYHHMYPLWWYPTSVYWSTGAMLQSIGQCFSQLGTASVNGALLQSMGQCFSQQELQWNLNVMPYCLESSFRRTSQCDVISIIGLIIQFFASAQIQQIRQRRRLFSRKWKQILQFYSRLKNCKLNPSGTSSTSSFWFAA